MQPSANELCITLLDKKYSSHFNAGITTKPTKFVDFEAKKVASTDENDKF